MPPILRDEPKATKTCPACGAVYDVTISGLLKEDCESFDCLLCGEQLDEWPSTIILEYRLVSQGSPPGAAESPSSESAIPSRASLV